MTEDKQEDTRMVALSPSVEKIDVGYRAIVSMEFSIGEKDQVERFAQFMCDAVKNALIEIGVPPLNFGSEQ